ncbi:hypothetical protein [Lichenibacterium dinghuense]|uniref:hypothetical protein n=1 Tax=Lichenibacterium dinghuense TaxID=2895977 RepID=UPI001F47B5B5|nr:hypothetical protein [Lichenibacterium sp. 6Y81]
MTRTLLPVALAAALLAAAAAPALAVSIKHTSRVDGDPEAAAAPRSASRATPPADTSGPHYFDKLHENGTRG